MTGFFTKHLQLRTMNRAALASVGLHAGVAFIAWGGLSYFESKTVFEETILNVDVVVLSDEVTIPFPSQDVPTPLRDTSVDAPPSPSAPRPAKAAERTSQSSPASSPLNVEKVEELIENDIEIAEVPPPEPKAEEPPEPDVKPEPVTEPKPEPVPEPVTEPEPAPEQPDANEAKETSARDFSAMLNQILEAPGDSNDTPTPEPQEPLAETDPIQTPDARIGAQLTVTEISLLSSHISKCWSPPTGVVSARNLIVDLHMNLSPTGEVVTLTVRKNARSQTIDTTDEAWQVALDAARRAVLNPECQPLPLPQEKYETWRQLVVEFDPTRMF